MQDMDIREIKTLMVRHYDYDPELVAEMTDEEIQATGNQIMEEFAGSELEEELKRLPDTDPDNEDNEDSTLLDLLDLYDDIHDDSDMYPNGRDDD